MTWGTLNYELYGPLLLLVPVYTDYFKIFAVVGFVCMHLSFGMCMQLGFFMYIPCAIALSFLPGLFWETISNWYTKLCVQLRRVPEGEYVVFVQLQDDADRPAMLRSIWWHLIITVGAYSENIKFNANVSEEVSQQMREAKLFFVVAQKLSANSFRWIPDWTTSFKILINHSPVYSLFTAPLMLLGVTRNTLFSLLRILCSSDSWRELRAREKRSLVSFSVALRAIGYNLAPAPQNTKRTNSKWTTWRRIFVTLFVVLMIIYCGIWNINSHFKQKQNETLLVISDLLRLDQWWGMFSPNPPLTYGWFVVRKQVCVSSC